MNHSQDISYTCLLLHPQYMANFVQTAVFVGVAGDATLQTIVNNSDDANKFGLKTYFEQHGSLESLFIAGGMMGLFSALYKYIDPEFNTKGLIAYGAILDIIFRFFRETIMPSLDDYYKHFNAIQTIVFAIIPFLMAKYLSPY